MIIPKTNRVKYIYKTHGVDCACPTHQGDKFSVLVTYKKPDNFGSALYWCKNCETNNN